MLYRSKNEVIEGSKNRPGAHSWFKSEGKYDAVINIPPTPNQELLNTVRNTLQGIRNVPGCSLRPQQSYGRTVLSQIMTTDIGTDKLCQRAKCMVCRKSDSNGGCRVQCPTYQIVCDRPPLQYKL